MDIETPPLGTHNEWEALQIFGKHLNTAYEDGEEPLTTEDLLKLYEEEAKQKFSRTFPKLTLEKFLTKFEGFFYYTDLEVWGCDPEAVVDCMDRYYSMVAEDYGEDWDKPWLNVNYI